MTPFTLGELLKVFEKRSDYSMWPLLLLYVVLRFLQGSGGLAALRDVCFSRIIRYFPDDPTRSYGLLSCSIQIEVCLETIPPFVFSKGLFPPEMSQLSFNHLLNLSFAFHTRRKTGEILRVLDRGAAINRILEVGQTSNAQLINADLQSTVDLVQHPSNFSRYLPGANHNMRGVRPDSGYCNLCSDDFLWYSSFTLLVNRSNVEFQSLPASFSLNGVPGFADK